MSGNNRMKSLLSRVSIDIVTMEFKILIIHSSHEPPIPFLGTRKGGLNLRVSKKRQYIYGFRGKTSM